MSTQQRGASESSRFQSWGRVLGHANNVERFRRAVHRGKLASTFLFTGPEGIGKRLFAETLAQTLLCQRRTPDQFAPCMTCSSCCQIIAGSHPDLLKVSRPPTKNTLPLELFIGEREQRSEVGLCRDIRLKPQAGSRKIAIIDDADYLSKESGNVLLKTLEEPPPGALLFLLGTSPQRQLVTILSRCQWVPFEPLAGDVVVTILESLMKRQPAEFPEELPAELSEIGRASQGSVQMAIRLCDSNVWELRQSLFQQLASADPGSDDFAAVILRFAGSDSRHSSGDSVGSEKLSSGEKKDRVYLLADLVVYFFESLLALLAGEELAVDRVLEEALATGCARWSGPWVRLGDAVERTCEFVQQVERNVNLANAVDPWLADLRRCAAGQPLPLGWTR